jgi:hypothetical protein
LPDIQRKIILAMLTYWRVCSACSDNFSLNIRHKLAGQPIWAHEVRVEDPRSMDGSSPN